MMVERYLKLFVNTQMLRMTKNVTQSKFQFSLNQMNKKAVRIRCNYIAMEYYLDLPIMATGTAMITAIQITNTNVPRPTVQKG